MKKLPKEFSDLERFVDAGWALPREHDRWRRRVESTTAEIKDFYETMLPRVDSIVQHLDRYSLEALPEKDRPLFYLALAFMDVAPAWEVFQASDLPEPVFPIDRMHIVEREYPWEKSAAAGA
jgi:hypothetical protein